MCVVSKDVFKHTYKLVCVFQEAASKMKKIYKRFMKGKACEGKMRSAPLGDVGRGGNLLNLMQFCLLRKGKGKEVRLIKKKRFGKTVSALEPKLLVRKICWLSERELC